MQEPEEAFLEATNAIKSEGDATGEVLVKPVSGSDTETLGSG